MSMSDLERRCFDAAMTEARCSYIDVTPADAAVIVRAVLAEAGVAELVEAAQGAVLALAANHPPGTPTVAMLKLRAALAKAGATQ